MGVGVLVGVGVKNTQQHFAFLSAIVQVNVPLVYCVADEPHVLDELTQKLLSYPLFRHRCEQVGDCVIVTSGGII